MKLFPVRFVDCCSVVKVFWFWLSCAEKRLLKWLWVRREGNLLLRAKPHFSECGSGGMLVRSCLLFWWIELIDYSVPTSNDVVWASTGRCGVNLHRSMWCEPPQVDVVWASTGRCGVSLHRWTKRELVTECADQSSGSLTGGKPLRLASDKRSGWQYLRCGWGAVESVVELLSKWCVRFEVDWCW